MLFAAVEFPSPCGVCGLKFARLVTLQNAYNTKFPSPCGVCGLKFYCSRCFVSHYDKVSVPLRGLWFEMREKGEALQVACSLVSVPLRGLWFEIC